MSIKHNLFAYLGRKGIIATTGMIAVSGAGLIIDKIMKPESKKHTEETAVSINAGGKGDYETQLSDNSKIAEGEGNGNSFKGIAKDKGFDVVECKTGESDHVHCFVSAPPKISVTQIVKYLKGISGNTLLYEFPELRESLWKGQLWNGSYFCETIGSISEENILKYIERQRTVSYE